MSILSKLTGIHIGSGPKKVNFAPPPEIAGNPEALAAWEKTQGQVNGTIGNAQKWNNAAMLAAPIAIGGAAALGLGGFGSGAAGAAGTAGGIGSSVPIGGATGAGGAASAGGGWLDKAKGVFSTGSDLLGKVNDATGGGSLLNKGLLAAAIADAAATRKRQADLQNQGLAYATDSYSARQPLRHQGLSMLQSQQTPDTGWVNNPANPYSRNPTPFNVSAKTPIMPSKGTY